jgi:hypothetical protein
MHSTTSAAHRRVGAAAVLAFLALLLLGLTRNSEAATAPVPAATPTVQPRQQQLPPFARPHDRGGDGFGRRGEDGGGGFGGGGQTAPAPSSGGTTT